MKNSGIFIFLLFALFLTGCSENERELEKLSYLTTDIEGKNQKVSKFSGTLMISKKNVYGKGKVSLAVTVRSDEGETVEFQITDYEENKIYPLKEMSSLDMYDMKLASSGSSRLFTGRFFF